MSQFGLTQLHLGLGSFHRAHQAVYLQNLHEQGDMRWGIVGGNIRPDMLPIVDALITQNATYTLETVSPQGKRKYQAITSIKSIIPWDKSLNGLIEVAIKSSTRIISFTVTEAGYYFDQNDQLDLDFSELRGDIEGTSCCTIYGALSVLLTERLKANGDPITLLNCDNLSHNGSRFLSGFLQFLHQQGSQELLNWVKQKTSSPNGMVDRITPRPTKEVEQRVLEATGCVDKASVMSEAFIQWVIEDDFINGRPAWEMVGVELVEDILPYEEAKIHLLNGSHCCFAWAGALKGFNYIHEDVQDSEIWQMAYDYMTNDVIPCLEIKSNSALINLNAYRDTVLDRFSNIYIQDTNQRVAMDGFSKIKGFILPILEEVLNNKHSIDDTSILLALFLAFLERQQRNEIGFVYEDQGMDFIVIQEICSAKDVVLAYASCILLFGKLAGDVRLINSLRQAYERVNKFCINSH